jgi:hypothetical protein
MRWKSQNASSSPMQTCWTPRFIISGTSNLRTEIHKLLIQSWYFMIIQNLGRKEDGGVEKELWFGIWHQIRAWLFLGGKNQETKTLQLNSYLEFNLWNHFPWIISNMKAICLTSIPNAKPLLLPRPWVQTPIWTKILKKECSSSRIWNDLLSSFHLHLSSNLTSLKMFTWPPSLQCILLRNFISYFAFTALTGYWLICLFSYVNISLLQCKLPRCVDFDILVLRTGSGV